VCVISITVHPLTHPPFDAAVSNAGGYHSTKDYFKNAANDPSVQRIAAISQAAVTLAERIDLQASQAATASQDTGLTGRTFRPSSGEEESWVSFIFSCLSYSYS
jgi:hypothetical protein